MLFCCCYHQLSGIQQKQSCLMGLSLKKKKLDFYQFFKGKSPQAIKCVVQGAG